MKQLRPHSEDTAVDNVSSPKPRTCGAYREDTQIRTGDNVSFCAEASCMRLRGALGILEVVREVLW